MSVLHNLESFSGQFFNNTNPQIQGIVQAFADALTHGAPACRTILVYIASIDPAYPTACFIHCTTGNNRSGVFIGVILSLLGVPASLIAEEYSLSNLGLQPIRDSVVERLMKSPVFANAGGGGRERAERMVGARPESMLAMLEMLEKRWGGAEGYVRNVCGLSEEEVEKVKAVLTVKESIVPQKRMSKVFATSKKFWKDLWKSFA
jgi:protein tyrosine/serine phosphatase